jgi:hypothetical protein
MLAYLSQFEGFTIAKCFRFRGGVRKVSTTKQGGAGGFSEGGLRGFDARRRLQGQVDLQLVEHSLHIAIRLRVARQHQPSESSRAYPELPWASHCQRRAPAPVRGGQEFKEFLDRPAEAHQPEAVAAPLASGKRGRNKKQSEGKHLTEQTGESTFTAA